MMVAGLTIASCRVSEFAACRMLMMQMTMPGAMRHLA